MTAEATAFRNALASYRDELLTGVDAETRRLWEEVTAAYCAEMDRIREHERLNAERFAERAAVWGEAWEAAFRAAGCQVDNPPQHPDHAS